MSASHPRAVIVIRYVTHYRVPFFEQLRTDLAARGVALDVVHGRPGHGPGAAPGRTAELPWATTVTNRWLGLGGRRLLWQAALPHTRGADLVIVEQASARLVTYLLFLGQLTGRTKLAFWGHGRNLKADRSSGVGELVKRVMSRRVHWWFAYNPLSVAIVRELGFPSDRITDVQNAIDTGALQRARAALAPEDLAATRSTLDLPGRHVGVYVGSMYPEKRLGFLIEAAVRVRAQLPDFALLLIGAGPDAHLAARAAAEHRWIHDLGPLFGTDTVPYVATADLLLMPGLVGLVVLDSFALEVPTVTTADAPHSPEIDYLEEGRNGVVLPAGTTPQGYADEVVRLLTDDGALAALRAGCREAATTYTVAEMSRRFADGVVAALAAPGRP